MTNKTRTCVKCGVHDPVNEKEYANMQTLVPQKQACATTLGWYHNEKYMSNMVGCLNIGEYVLVSCALMKYAVSRKYRNPAMSTSAESFALPGHITTTAKYGEGMAI